MSIPNKIPYGQLYDFGKEARELNEEIDDFASDIQMPKCSYCCERDGADFNTDTKCAFPGENKFHKDNWNCAAMNILRDFIDESGFLKELNDVDKIRRYQLQKIEDRFQHHELYVGDDRDDLSAASIGILRIPEECVIDDGSGLLKGGGYVVMSRYKERGTTGMAIRMWDDMIYPLTFDVVDRLIKYIRK